MDLVISSLGSFTATPATVCGTITYSSTEAPFGTAAAITKEVSGTL